MNKLFLSCLKASELIEKKLHFKLSWMEALQLKVHKAMCEACKLYENQSEFLEKGIAGYNNPKPEQISMDDLKASINSKLAEQKD